MRRVLLAVLLALPMAGAENGTLLETVAARSDPSQSYTVYLPPALDAKTQHPLLLVFDPRGRGTYAVSLFRDGAERFGWIVIGANGTHSDAEGEGNARAVAALLGEIDRYAVDPRRVYTAGFSGTAMLAAAVAVNNTSIAGVIGVGGRRIDELQPREYGFAHFGAAGQFDFNNRDMRAIDDELEEGGRDHRFVEFDGDHRWFDSELAADAMRWLEIVAMRRGLRSRDAEMIDASWTKDMADVERLIAKEAFTGAHRLLRSMPRTYDGLRPTAESNDRASRLADDRLALAARAEEQKWDAFEAAYLRDVFTPPGRLFAGIRTPPDADTVSRLFRLADLQRRAKRSGAEASASRRLLEAVYAQTSFYLPRQLFARGDYAFAAAVLRVAASIHPERAGAWYELARAEALALRRKQALGALATAVEKGFGDRQRLLADEAFASLREERQFRMILKRVP